MSTKHPIIHIIPWLLIACLAHTLSSQPHIQGQDITQVEKVIEKAWMILDLEESATPRVVVEKAKAWLENYNHRQYIKDPSRWAENYQNMKVVRYTLAYYEAKIQESSKQQAKTPRQKLGAEKKALLDNLESLVHWDTQALKADLQHLSFSTQALQNNAFENFQQDEKLLHEVSKQQEGISCRIKSMQERHQRVNEAIDNLKKQANKVHNARGEVQPIHYEIDAKCDRLNSLFAANSRDLISNSEILDNYLNKIIRAYLDGKLVRILAFCSKKYPHLSLETLGWLRFVHDDSIKMENEITTMIADNKIRQCLENYDLTTPQPFLERIAKLNYQIEKLLMLSPTESVEYALNIENTRYQANHKPISIELQKSIKDFEATYLVDDVNDMDKKQASIMEEAFKSIVSQLLKENQNFVILDFLNATYLLMHDQIDVEIRKYQRPWWLLKLGAVLGALFSINKIKHIIANKMPTMLGPSSMMRKVTSKSVLVPIAILALGGGAIHQYSSKKPIAKPSPRQKTNRSLLFWLGMLLLLLGSIIYYRRRNNS